MKPDEPITPKASQRVIEGDVVEDPKRDAKASASPKSSTPKKSSQWLPQTFMQKMVMVFLLAMLGLGSFWVWQSNQQDWQIERINQLQQHQKALKEVSESLQKRLQEQAKQIEQLSVPAQKPVFSQADLDHMNHFKPSHHVVAKCNRLCGLQMSEPGHDRLSFFFSQL